MSVPINPEPTPIPPTPTEKASPKTIDTLTQASKDILASQHAHLKASTQSPGQIKNTLEKNRQELLSALDQNPSTKNLSEGIKQDFVSSQIADQRQKYLDPIQTNTSKTFKKLGQIKNEILSQQVPKNAGKTLNPSYSWEDYNNNWGGGPVPAGVNGDLAFADVNADGSFSSQYPLGGTTDNGLAIGGWDDSQPGAGLNSVLTQPLVNGNLTSTQQTLLNNIVDAVERYGYSRVVMDFEDYGDKNAQQTSASYTMFLEKLGAKLHSLDPPVSLEMAISPAISNQDYFNINTLVSTGAVDKFQLMCYDYEQGSPASTGLASVAQTQDFINKMLANYPTLSQSKLLIGFPLYGGQYTLPPNLTPDEVLQALNSGSGVTFNSGEVGDNKILSEIGSWTSPTGDWKKITDGKTPPTYFYYNQTTGTLYNTFPPASMQDFANMIKTNFPDVAGFFGWESSDDLPGGSLYQTMMSCFQSSSPPIAQAITEVETWLESLKGVSSSWKQNLENQLQSSPPNSTQALATWLNEIFNSQSGKNDIYMQEPGLIQQIGGQGGRLDNQLNDLFTNNSNLLSLLNMGLTIPPVTPADSLYINLLGWTPPDSSGDTAKSDVLNQLKTYGSTWSQSAIKQYYWWPLEPTLSAADQAFLSQVMYANT